MNILEKEKLTILLVLYHLGLFRVRLAIIHKEDTIAAYDCDIPWMTLLAIMFDATSRHFCLKYGVIDMTIRIARVNRSKPIF